MPHIIAGAAGETAWGIHSGNLERKGILDVLGPGNESCNTFGGWLSISPRVACALSRGWT